MIHRQSKPSLELLSILVCPETQQEIALAPPDLLAQLNHQIAIGALRCRNGEHVKELLGAGLLRQDGKVLYQIRHGIPIMLIGESVAL